jgi:hypothetical protein
MEQVQKRVADQPKAAEIVVFVPRAELDARANLGGFVAVCRDRLTALGADLPFDADRWDVTAASNRRAMNCRETVSFTALSARRRDKDSQSMAEPFKSFAKAYLRYQHAMHPSKSFPQRISALRVLERALTEQGASADPTTCTRHTVNLAARLLAERYGRAAAYSAGQQLELLAKFLDDHRLVATPLRWKNSIKRPQSRGRVGADFDEERRKKLPSASALNAIAQIFRMAESPEDVITASVCAILSSAPSRINEACHLEARCEVSETVPSTGESAFGLRWRPSKGGEAMVKWCTQSMTTVVQEAVAKIRAITEEARAIARWYEQNPGKVYLPPHLEHLRSQQRLTHSQVCDIVFYTRRDSSASAEIGRMWCSQSKIPGEVEGGTTARSGCITVAFKDVELVLVGMLPRGFPVANKETGLKFSDALLLVRRNELSSMRSTYRGVIHLVDVAAIRSRLAGSGQRQNIFQRFGFCEDDGSVMRITTHQFRHYLNTIAQSGGLSELDIAKWSGRVNVSQNAVYNHVSDRDVLALVREAIGDETRMFGPLSKVPTKALIPRDEFARLKAQTAHATEFGYCIHDFTMLPCQVHRDCMNCDEQVCIKGDTAKEAAIRHCRTTTRELLDEAQAGERSGEFGASRWVEHQTGTLERLDQLCAILDNPRVPNGSVIQPTGVVPASRLEQATNRRRLTVEGALKKISETNAPGTALSVQAMVRRAS